MELCIGTKFVSGSLPPTPSVQFAEMTVSVSRSEVRAAGRAARATIEGTTRTRAESALVDHLRSLDALRAPSVGLFVAHDGEPDLSPLVGWLWGRGVTVALPVLNDDPDDYSMRFVSWLQHDVLARGRYGIPVPPRDQVVMPATLLVSLTGFDAFGNRIGRGAGFFDRYLEGYSGQVVGVGFEAQRFDLVPTEAHDQALPMMVTDLGVRNFVS